MTYKHDAVIRAWLDGRTVQQQSRDCSWHDVRAVGILSVVPAFSEDESYRIKPEVVKYRRWLRDHGNGVYSIGTVTFESSVSGTEKHHRFVRWIDTEWQEVEV